MEAVSSDTLGQQSTAPHRTWGNHVASVKLIPNAYLKPSLYSSLAIPQPRVRLQNCSMASIYICCSKMCMVLTVLLYYIWDQTTGVTALCGLRPGEAWNESQSLDWNVSCWWPDTGDMRDNGVRDGCLMCLMWRLQLGHGELQHETHPQHMHIRAYKQRFHKHGECQLAISNSDTNINC